MSTITFGSELSGKLRAAIVRIEREQNQMLAEVEADGRSINALEDEIDRYECHLKDLRSDIEETEQNISDLKSRLLAVMKKLRDSDNSIPEASVVIPKCQMELIGGGV